MNRFILILLLVAGCSGNSATQTAQTTKSKVETKAYKPSELVGMEALPKETILVKCRVLLFNRNNPNEIFLTVGDWEIAVGREEPVIYAVLQAGDDGFSKSILEWYERLQNGSILKLNGTAVRIEENKKAVYLRCTGIN